MTDIAKMDDKSHTKVHIYGYVQLDVNTTALKREFDKWNGESGWDFDIIRIRDRLHSYIGREHGERNDDDYKWWITLNFKKHEGLRALLRKDGEEAEIKILLPFKKDESIVVMAKENVTASDAQKIVGRVCKVMHDMAIMFPIRSSGRDWDGIMSHRGTEGGF
jgi:hypothetical protein